MLVIISPAFFYLPQDVSDITETTEGLGVFLFAISAMFSSLLTNLLADFLGRKKALAICDVILIIGAIVTISAGHSTTLIAGRVLTGVADGFVVALNPVYVAEMTPTKYRGGCLSLLTAAWLTAEAVALAVALVTAPMWKVMVGVGVIPAVLHLIALAVYLPESPRWLVQHNHTQTALTNMHRYYTGNTDTITSFLQSEITGIQTEITRNSHSKSTISALCTLLFTTYRANFMYVNAYLALFQLSGFAGVMYFSSQVMASVGFRSDFEANLAAMVLFLIGAAACFVNMVIVDRVGRRWILLAFIPLQIGSIVVLSLGTY